MTRKYIGTKEVLAWEQEKDGQPGYSVRYEDGYTSWSPKGVFEDAYRVTEGASQALNFGDAIHLLKQGKKLARAGWNGEGMFIFLVPGSTFAVNRPPLLGIYLEGTTINYHAHIDMRTADGHIVPWLASQTDILASDWACID